GLLANAVGQPMNPSTDTLHSRASPLPHFFDPVRLQISARCYTADLLFCGSWLACDADTSVYQ
ncbi:MAG: hypothetical protein WBB95_05120, partial [Pseudomonas sp.]|uniref:hypothetical protein n=1 Tax=Pseudomonas sp. TaxID=306 RepID=UPI003C791FB2